MRVRTNKYLHKPFRLLWFEADEIFLFFIGAIFSIYITIWIGFFFFLLVFLIHRNKNKQPRGFIRHFFYYLGLLRFKGFPSFFENNFQE